MGNASEGSLRHMEKFNLAVVDRWMAARMKYPVGAPPVASQTDKKFTSARTEKVKVIARTVRIFFITRISGFIVSFFVKIKLSAVHCG
jgi:hypothetical protein